MKSGRILILAIATLLVAGVGHATPYSIYAYDETRHAVWIPGLEQRNLLLDDGATFTMQDDSWHLDGSLTSANDGSAWVLSVGFGGVMTGTEFGEWTGYDDGRVKGAHWVDMYPDWTFAEKIDGTLTALTGDHAGRTFSLERFAGQNDYWAQFGTCMNDKNCDKGLSTWLTFTDTQTGEAYRGDINARVEMPVPEPGAALVFAAGTLIIGTATKNRARA